MRIQVNQFTLPAEAILIRRMHGIVAVVLGQLRAGADWGAIAAEYLHGEAPATPLGQAEAEFLAGRGQQQGPPTRHRAGSCIHFDRSIRTRRGSLAPRIRGQRDFAQTTRRPTRSFKSRGDWI